LASKPLTISVNFSAAWPVSTREEAGGTPPLKKQTHDRQPGDQSCSKALYKLYQFPQSKMLFCSHVILDFAALMPRLEGVGTLRLLEHLVHCSPALSSHVALRVRGSHSWNCVAWMGVRTTRLLNSTLTVTGF
jgi:hypothetical protein